MNINSLFPRLAVVSALVMAGAVVASGQSYYDDDIYYDASKAPKKEAKQSKQTKSSNRTGNSSTQLYYDGAQYVPWNNVGEYQSADQYQASGTSTRDVDEYNRRYAGVSESRSNEPDSITLQQFEAMSNTRKLARFQNSDVASQAYAQSEYDDAGYYADGYANGYGQPVTTINLNVVGGYPYYGYPYYGYGYYGSPWYWNRWGYDWGWGPSWSWNWGWAGPSWSWGWSWGGPCWGPSWGPSWGGGWHGRPHYTSSGAFAPNSTRRPSGNSYRNMSNSGTTYRYGNYSGGNRTGNSSARPGNSVSTSRPGYRQPIGSPSVNNGGTRGRNVGTYNQNNNYNSNSNQSTYRYNSNSSNYNRGSSFGSGSRGSSSGSFGGNRGGFSGGNRTGGGGGGHRGR